MLCYLKGYYKGKKRCIFFALKEILNGLSLWKRLVVYLQDWLLALTVTVSTGCIFDFGFQKWSVPIIWRPLSITFKSNYCILGWLQNVWLVPKASKTLLVQLSQILDTLCKRYATHFLLEKSRRRFSFIQ